MPYNITLTNGTELITGGLLDNTIDNTNSTLVLVGKNYKSYGIFLNQNFVRLMENFANPSAPPAPIPGQLWFNSTSKLLTINISNVKGTASAIWKTLAGMTLSATTPTNAYIGEQWYDTTNGQLKIYTGTEWRLIGPLSRIETGNSGAIPDIVTDAPPSTTFVVIKFLIDNVVAGIWSNDGPFASDEVGFSTIKKGLNLNSTLGHTFWGNSEVANSLYVNGLAIAGNAFLRSDISGTINGSLTVSSDNGLTFGLANDFVGNVVSGTVILKNQTNNKDLILSLKSGGLQTPFLRGNHLTGHTEAYRQITSSSPPLSYATKNYVDILSGSITGVANFSGHVTPNLNATYTLGNATNRWSNVFSQSMSVTDVFATNTSAIVSNVALVYISSDFIPTVSNTSNIGALGMQFNSIHARSATLTTALNIGTSLTVGTTANVTGSLGVGGNQTLTGTLSISAATDATSTSTGAITVSGGAGVAGNLHIGGAFVSSLLQIPGSGSVVVGSSFNPNSNVTYTLGNTTNRWNNIFSESILVGNILAANIATTNSNIAQIYLGADIIPTANLSSNLGSQGVFLNTVHSQTILSSGSLIIANTGDVSANIGAYQIFANSYAVTQATSINNINANIGAYQLFANANAATQTTLINNNNTSVTAFQNYANLKIGTNTNSNLVVIANTTSVSTTTGALVVGGGLGVAGNINVGGEIRTPTLPTTTSNTSVATTAFVQSLVTPSGSLLMWPTASAPSGYLLCDGSAVSRTTYSTLFGILGTTFGAGDNSTTFNLPNYTNRLPVGAGGLYSVGATGGSKDAITVAHTHSLSGGSVSGTFVTGVSTTSSSFNTFGINAITSVSTSTGSPSYSNPTVQSAGSSGTNANMPPYLAIYFIIKT